jgi:hypothetical protein
MWDRHRVSTEAEASHRCATGHRYAHYAVPRDAWDELPPEFEWLHRRQPHLLRIAGLAAGRAGDDQLAAVRAALRQRYPAALLQRVERCERPRRCHTFLDVAVDLTRCRRLPLPAGEALGPASPVGERAVQVSDEAGQWAPALRTLPLRRQLTPELHDDPWWVRAQVPADGRIGHFRGPRRSLRTGALRLEALDLLIPHLTAEEVADSAVGAADRTQHLPCLRFVGVLDLDLPLEAIKLGEAPLRVGGECVQYPHRTFATGSRQLTKAGAAQFKADLAAAVRGAGSVEALGRTLTGFEALRQTTADVVAHLRRSGVDEVQCWFSGMKGFRVVWRGERTLQKVRWGEAYPDYVMDHLYPAWFGEALWGRLQRYADKNVLDANKGVKTDLHPHHTSKLHASLGWTGPLRTSPCPQLHRTVRGFWARMLAALPSHGDFGAMPFLLDGPSVPPALAALLTPHRLGDRCAAKQSVATHHWPPNGPATYYNIPPESWLAIEALLWAAPAGDPPLLAYCYAGARPHALQLDLDKCPLALAEVAQRCRRALAAALGGADVALALEQSPGKAALPGLQFGRCTFPHLVVDEKNAGLCKALCVMACSTRWPEHRQWGDVIDPQSRGARTHHSAKLGQLGRLSRPLGCWDAAGEPLAAEQRAWYCPLRPPGTPLTPLPAAAASAAAAWLRRQRPPQRKRELLPVQPGERQAKRIKTTVSERKCQTIVELLQRTPLYREHPFSITTIRDPDYSSTYLVGTDCRHCERRRQETAGGCMAGHPAGATHKDNHLFFVITAERCQLRCNAEWHRRRAGQKSVLLWSSDADPAFRALLVGSCGDALFGVKKADIQALVAGRTGLVSRH